MRGEGFLIATHVFTAIFNSLLAERLLPGIILEKTWPKLTGEMCIITPHVILK